MAHRLPTPVHPALLNGEVVSIICQSLDPKSLSALARTTKFLLDPSLNELWREIDDIIYLLFPFKSSVDTTETKPDFPDVPIPIQWDRFNFYARRVKTLHIMGMDHTELSFLMLSPHRPLLPHLQSLVAGEWSHIQILCYLSIFFTGSLRKFKIHDKSGDVALLKPLIATLAAAAPELQHLEIGIYSSVPHDLGRAVPLFRNLCSIKMPLTGSQAHSVLSHLSTLPSLSVLRFDVTSLTESSPTDSIYTFPVARHLYIRSKSDTESQNLLAMTQFNNLTELRISCIKYQIVDESLFETISFCCGQSLEYVSITDGVIDHHLGLEVPDTHWYPLRKFTNLRHLSLTNEFYPSNEDIDDAIKSWPNIETFHIRLCYFQADFHVPFRCPLTLAGLLLLIEGCTSLVDLVIAVDAQHLPNITNPIVRLGLSIKLCPFDSSIACPAALANFFSTVLPDACIRVADDLHETDNCHLWKDMVFIYRHLVKARKEERIRVIKQVQDQKILG